jgi:hypothetical protein
MIEKNLGRIRGIHFGMGGYDDAMFGLTISLGDDSSFVTDFRGTWAFSPSESTKWTLEDQTELWGVMCRWIVSLLQDSKKKNLLDLVGTPVEITLENNRLLSWRILKEVI